MISLKIQKQGKTIYFVGLEKSDQEALQKDALLSLKLPFADIKLMNVNIGKDEFMKQIQMMQGSTNGTDPAPKP